MKPIIKYSITALFVLIGFSLNAQTVQFFNKVYSLGLPDTVYITFSSVISHNDQYVTFGTRTDANKKEVVAFKMDSIGNIVDKVILDDRQNLNTIYTDRDMIRNSEGDFVCFFSYALDTMSDGWLNYDIHLVKFKEDGEILWLKTYGGTDDESPQQIIETSDGGYLITGFSRDELNDDWFRYYVLKLDKDGNEQWQRNFGEPHWHAKSGSAVETQSGHFLIAGWVLLEGLKQEKMFIKLDQSGNVVWERIFGNEYSDCGSRLVALNDSVIYEFSCIRDTTYRSYIALINEELDIYSDTAYFLPYDKFYGMQSLPIILENGSVVSSGTFVNEYGNWQPYLIKFNRNLEIEWLHSFSLKDQENCILNSIDTTPDGGFILAGMQWSGNKDGWLLKVDSLGRTCSYLDCDSIATIPVGVQEVLAGIDLGSQFPDTLVNAAAITKIERDSLELPNGILSNTDSHYLNLYPNPAKNRLSLNYRLPPYAGDHALLVFYNTEGKMIRIENLSSFSTEYAINLHYWARGLYVYKVHLYDQVLFEGKLVVE